MSPPSWLFGKICTSRRPLRLLVHGVPALAHAHVERMVERDVAGVLVRPLRGARRRRDRDRRERRRAAGDEAAREMWDAAVENGTVGHRLPAIEHPFVSRASNRRRPSTSPRRRTTSAARGATRSPRRSRAAPGRPSRVIPSTRSRCARDRRTAASSIGVSVGPGATQLTAMPCGASARAALRESASTAPLLAAYAAVPESPPPRLPGDARDGADASAGPHALGRFADAQERADHVDVVDAPERCRR